MSFGTHTPDLPRGQLHARPTHLQPMPDFMATPFLLTHMPRVWQSHTLSRSPNTAVSHNPKVITAVPVRVPSPPPMCPLSPPGTAAGPGSCTALGGPPHGSGTPGGTAANQHTSLAHDVCRTLYQSARHKKPPNRHAACWGQHLGSRPLNRHVASVL